jgi:hypothetical protein
MRRAGVLFLSAAAASMGCALVGYDLDGYELKDTSAAGGGGTATTAGMTGAGAGSGTGTGSGNGTGSGSTGSVSAGSGVPLNCAGGPFMMTSDVTVNFPPAALHVDDLDGDLKPDVVMVNPADSKLSRIFIDGKGALIDEQIGGVGINNPLAVTTGQLDMNPLHDIVISNAGGEHNSLLNPGRAALGTLTLVGECAGPAEAVIGAFDGPGDLYTDLAFTCSGSDAVFLSSGMGNGTFSAATPIATIKTPSAIVAADLNDDQLLDMVVRSGDDKLVVLIASKTAGYTPTNLEANMPRKIAIGKFNDDPYPDIAVTSGIGLGTLYLSSDKGVFSTSKFLDFGAATDGIATGDFNRDGLLDIAASSPDKVIILLNSGNGFFDRQTQPGLAGGTALEAADMNNDGALDLIEGSSSESKVLVFVNTCTLPAP